MAIQIRRGTDAEWEAGKQDIVVGEPCVTTDTGRFFVGTADGFSEMARMEDIGSFEEDIETLQGDITEINEALETKADKSDTYSKEDVDGLLDGKASTEALEELSEQMDSKADADSVYTKSETDTLLSGKASSSDLEELEEEMADYKQMYLDSLIHTTASGSIASFFHGFKDAPMDSCTASIEPVQEGSGDPSPTNIRPISGWTGAEVVRSGKNLWNPNRSDKELGYYDLNGTFHPSVTYACLSFPCSSGDKFVKSGSGWGGIVTFWNGDTFVSGVSSASVTVPTNANKAKFSCLLSSTDCQLEKGSTATAYEPYQANTYSVTWEEQGTVYGGSVDLVSGLLTVDRAIVEITSATLYGTYDSDAGNGTYWYTSGISALAQVNDGVVCNRLKTVNNVTTTSADGVLAWFANGIIRWTEQRSMTATEYNAYLAENPLQLTYRLQTPTTVQLTPQEIKTLLGNNNVWSDTGDTSVGYVADTKLYIDSKLS